MPNGWRDGLSRRAVLRGITAGAAATLCRAPRVSAAMDYQVSGSAVWLLNKAPRPNAARVFLNWLLTKDAQAAWAKELQTNSRFVGVEPGDPHTVVPAGLSLTQIDSEELLADVVKTQDLAKQLIR